MFTFLRRQDSSICSQLYGYFSFLLYPIGHIKLRNMGVIRENFAPMTLIHNKNYIQLLHIKIKPYCYSAINEGETPNFNC